jgi:hypothetical protein
LMVDYLIEVALVVPRAGAGHLHSS